MHNMIRGLILFMFIHISGSNGLDLTDIGLPTFNPCAISYNESLYIIDTDLIILSFQSPSQPPVISNKTLSIPYHTDCVIARNKVILMPILKVLDITSLSWDNNITIRGDATAIKIFKNTTHPLNHYAITLFNDLLFIFGGERDNKISRLTYMLDLRIPTLWTWLPLPPTPETPPASIYTSLHSTSRWILHFRLQSYTNSTSYVHIDCFDPQTYRWKGVVSSFIYSNLSSPSAPDLIQPTTLTSTSLHDHVLLIPAYRDIPYPDTNASHFTFWKVSISKTSTDTTTTELTSQQLNAYRSFRPVSGGSVTSVTPELTVLYGGMVNTLVPGTIHFMNASNGHFLDPPAWLSLPNNTDDNTPASVTASSTNLVPIIVGSVLGGLLFLVLVTIVIYFLIKRKKRKQSSGYDSQPTREINHEDPHQFLSAIRSFTPIDMFGPIVAPNDTIADTEHKKPQLISRFKEHFDIHGFAQRANVDLSDIQLPSSSRS
ncbi:hypothetical protein BDB01DRAFT_802930 [Pilobolus umbonatus]|nr:hypothetical protein BDB01DRAFT_802930 [Pilobolus umbonatus]